MSAKQQIPEMNGIETGYKFILAYVDDQLVVRANDTIGYDGLDSRGYLHPLAEGGHWELYKWLKEEAPDCCINCLGGGRIKIDKEAKTVRVWGSSSNFFDENRKTRLGRSRFTIPIIQRAFPGFQVFEEVPEGEDPD